MKFNYLKPDGRRSTVTVTDRLFDLWRLTAYPLREPEPARDAFAEQLEVYARLYAAESPVPSNFTAYVEQCVLDEITDSIQCIKRAIAPERSA